MSRIEQLRKLEQELRRATEGISPLARALTIATALREAYEGEWVIEIRGDEHFVIRPK
jgi:hypothetical protein